MPAGAVTLATPPAAGDSGPPGLRTALGSLVTTVLAVAALVAAACGWSLAWGLLTLVAVAWAVAPGWRGTVSALPTSALVVSSTGIVVLVASGLLGQRVLLTTAGARAVLVLVTGAALAAAIAVHRDRPAVAREGRSLLLAAAPAALMAALLVAIRWSGDGRLAWFLSADHLRHLGLTTRTIDAGVLDYASQPFPRGWHALMAGLWSATGADRDGDGLERLVGLQSAATWTLLVLLPLALALVALATAEAVGLGPVASGLAGLLAGSLVLGPSFFGDYVPRGFDTTILVVLVLAAAVQVVLAGPASRAALAAASAACLVTAHTWQVILVPAVALAVAVVVWRRPWSLPARARAADGLLVAGLAAASIPGVTGVVHGLGIEQAALEGDVPPPVLGWFLAVVLACVVLVVVGRGVGLPVVVPSVAAAVTAWGLAAATGVDIGSYYPSKTLWVATVLGLPALSVVALLALRRVDGTTPVRRVATVLGGAVLALAVLVSAVTPVFGVLRASWGGADPAAVMRVATSEPAETATVVWRVGTPVDDATTQLLLDFYSATADTPRLGLAATQLPEQCALLASVPAPRVLSTAPQADVLARFTCRPDVTVVAPPTTGTEPAP